MSQVLRDQLAGFIAERFLFDPGAVVADETTLFSAGVIDSFGVMELLLKIEELYGVQLDVLTLVDNEVDTFASLVETVEQVGA